MDTKAYQEAVALAEARQHLYIATVDDDGYPHLASAGSFVPLPQQQVEVGDCFCPTLLKNLRHHSYVSLVVWDITTDTGYQLVGAVEAVATPEGLLTPGAKIISTGLEGNVMRIQVQQVMAFSHAPHSDLDLTCVASNPVVTLYSSI